LVVWPPQSSSSSFDRFSFPPPPFCSPPSNFFCFFVIAVLHFSPVCQSRQVVSPPNPFFFPQGFFFSQPFSGFGFSTGILIFLGLSLSLFPPPPPPPHWSGCLFSFPFPDLNLPGKSLAPFGARFSSRGFFLVKLFFSLPPHLLVASGFRCPRNPKPPHGKGGLFVLPT